MACSSNGHRVYGFNYATDVVSTDSRRVSIAISGSGQRREWVAGANASRAWFVFPCSRGLPGELLWHCLSVEVDVRALPRKGEEDGYYRGLRYLESERYFFHRGIPAGRVKGAARSAVSW